MTAQEIKELEELLDVFAMPGWQHLMTDLERAKIAYLQNIHYDVQDNDAYQQRRGQLLELDRWLVYEDNAKRMYEEVTTEEDSAVEQ